MTWEDQVFFANVVVIDLTWEMMSSSVISWLTNAITKLNTIAKIHKYKRLHEGYHFILMAMEVHSTLGRDLDSFIKECVRLLHDRCLKGHLSLSFYIYF
jgi:hypothetical protein